MRTAQESLEELHKLLLEKELYDQMVSQLNRKIGFLKNEAAETMGEQDISELSIDGIKYKPFTEESTVLKEDASSRTFDECDEFMDFVREVDPGIIKTLITINPATRKAWLKRRIEAGEKIPDCVEIKYFDTVKFTGTHIKKLGSQVFADRLREHAKMIGLPE